MAPCSEEAVHSSAVLRLVLQLAPCKRLVVSPWPDSQFDQGKILLLGQERIYYSSVRQPRILLHDFGWKQQHRFSEVCQTVQRVHMQATGAQTVQAETLLGIQCDAPLMLRCTEAFS